MARATTWAVRPSSVISTIISKSGVATSVAVKMFYLLIGVMFIAVDCQPLSKS